MIKDNNKQKTKKSSILIGDIKYLSFNSLCSKLSISTATGKNWIRLNKLVPDYMDGNTPYFSSEYLRKVRSTLKSDDNKFLKSRRNKKFVSGSSLYSEYVSPDCKAIEAIQILIKKIEEQKVKLTAVAIQSLIADCSIQIICQRENISANAPHLKNFLEGRIDLKNYSPLIYDLITSREESLEFIDKFRDLFDISYHYEGNEDLLGLVYISFQNLGNRKATGAYYTPSRVIKELITKLFENSQSRNQDNIIDPCCGTGNFLLQLPDNIRIENIFGVDIDELAVKITRINLAIKYRIADIKILYSNIIKADYLLKNKIDRKFKYIVGNPPWGYDFSAEEQKFLKKNYRCAKGKNIESYDLFLEKALNDTLRDGYVSFVLPEALLNVKTHLCIREQITKCSSIRYLSFLGNAFDKVQCPCIILQIKKTEQPISCIGMEVSTAKESFVIHENRDLSPLYFSFLTTDEEYKLIKKITNYRNVAYLKDSSTFALGIVTGNNSEFISDSKNEHNEMILKGKDIFKYKYKNSNNFIIFDKNRLQQVAPEEIYRADEKLLYRFISNQLIFAYDNKKTLTLNSCNVLIPHLDGMNIKYIMAILNSSVSQFLFHKQFNSLKVLRSHIESIPLPRTDNITQNNIVELVDKILSTDDDSACRALSEEIDLKIAEIFGITSQEYELIKKDITDNAIS